MDALTADAIAAISLRGGRRPGQRRRRRSVLDRGDGARMARTGRWSPFRHTPCACPITGWTNPPGKWWCSTEIEASCSHVSQPNHRRQYSMRVEAPAVPGKYLLQATMLQESVGWFEYVQPAILREFAVRRAATHASPWTPAGEGHRRKVIPLNARSHGTRGSVSAVPWRPATPIPSRRPSPHWGSHRCCGPTRRATGRRCDARRTSKSWCGAGRHRRRVPAGQRHLRMNDGDPW